MLLRRSFKNCSFSRKQVYSDCCICSFFQKIYLPALKQLGIFRTLLHRILHEIGLKPYRPHLLQVLNEDDSDKQLEFCENFVQFCEESPGSVTVGTPCVIYIYIYLNTTLY